MILPWHHTTWQQLAGALSRLPHALLLAGPSGGGKRAFAQALAQRILCEAAQGEAPACGVCDACRWFLADNHPDMRAVCPASDQEPEAEEATEKTPARSTQIRIDQIRGLAEFLSVGAVRAGRRVVVLTPAEAMNTATANALLKLLEEPPAHTQFILVSDEPRRLLPTVRSRTQVWAFPEPPREQSLDWLKAQGVPEPARWLDFTGGMPLAAREGARLDEAVARFLRDIESLSRTDPLALAAQWEAWVKPKAGGEITLAMLCSWLQKWLFDLVAVKASGEPRFFSARREALRDIAQRASFPALQGAYNTVTQMRRVASHPLNARLFLDDMLLRYARLVAA